MGLSFMHILVVLVLVLILFGAGKLPKVMGDFGKGLRAFKDGWSGKDEEPKKLSDNSADNSEDKK